MVTFAAAVAVLGFTLTNSLAGGRFLVAGDGVIYTLSEGPTWSGVALTGTGCAEPMLVLTPNDLGEGGGARAPLIRCLMDAPDAAVRGSDAAGQVQVQPLRSRPKLWHLTADVWIPVIIGLLSWGLSGGLWAFRPRELATQLFALGGLAFMSSLLIIGSFTAHHPGSDPAIFSALLHANLIANQTFYFALMALFLSYPVRLIPPVGAWGVVALSVPCALAQVSLISPAVTGLLAVANMLVIIALIVWQFFATRAKPRERAALTWLGLSVAVGCALWAGTLAIGMLQGGSGDPGVFGLVLFFPFYVGLTLGVARFCLVELQDWTFRILFFLAAAVLFLAVDAALVMVAGLGQGVALTVTLLVVAFGYLPVRDLVWRRLRDGKTLSEAAMFEAVLAIAFAATPGERAQRWRDLLQGLFRPLRIEPAPAEVAEATISGEGLHLSLPAAAEAPALILSYARDGRGLFSPSQLRLARQLVQLVRTASQSRDAWERGAATVRRQMAQDLHDDVGARLLSGLNQADAVTRPILHDALRDIRAISSAMLGQTAPLDGVMADIRFESVRRLEAAGVVTDWPLWPHGGPAVLADYRLQKALTSGLREIVSNIIKHAGARHVAVDMRLEGDALTCAVADDGVGLSDLAVSGETAGQGLKGLQRRAGEVGGSVRFDSQGGGTRVVLTLPLRPNAEILAP
ncbi:histidine kinase-, DNA gyrase B-, and HSP90-like ATPase family protein [Asticcacaulis biprosthecium C19]|uniref:histidine kinase n=2 Tax=Asticcacaulis biprosthecium TaxID=76891 RepID=F4QM49_9CAUL|nr:histidine kinase-, DNA gyrase B-, and HSP90-like ATPase family protein [Asticcacaulis biprosthecium C19]